MTCKAFGVKNLNIENNNLNTSIDHTEHHIYGILQTKLSTYDTAKKYWHVNIKSEQTKIYDNIIIYCMDKEMKNVIITLIIPRSEILYETDIYIYENWSKTYSRLKRLEKYRVDDKPYNDVYHNLIEEDLKGLKDVKSFLEYIIQKENRR